ncbi:MAG TPA: hypothetical protein VHP36_01810 [Chitinispirillaceae bacterium]|nr:hypothetical protein [Chitinispirillaceae bacterium]
MNSVQYKNVVHYGKKFSENSKTGKKTAEEWNIIWLNKLDRIVETKELIVKNYPDETVHLQISSK